MVNVVLLKKEIDDMQIPYAALARKCGVSRQTVSNWVNHPENISATNAKNLADALRITDTDKLMAIFFAPNVEDISTNETIETE